MIERSGERWSGISVLAARHDDDDDDRLIILNKDSFGIKQPRKIDMPLTKETKPYICIYQPTRMNRM